MLNLIQATIYDAPTLTELAIDSEATWGSNETFMEIFKVSYAVTPSFIENNLVYKMMDQDDCIGFFSIIKEDYISELEYFYIAAPFIGKGYGKKMWQFMRQICRDEHIEQIEFVTSPEAVYFYKSCGAEHIDTVPSLVVKGRMIPKFIYKIS